MKTMAQLEEQLDALTNRVAILETTSTWLRQRLFALLQFCGKLLT